MVWFISFFTLAGINFTIWLIIGIIRYFKERKQLKEKNHEIINVPSLKKIAAIVPAHNEERTIRRTLEALLRVLPKKNIYVANDNSSDATLDIVRSMGVRSLDIKPNMGKARSLAWILHEYDLLDAYEFIIINDADTEITPEYIPQALPFFKKKDIAAVATHGVTRWENYNFYQKFFISYRIRLWKIIQLGFRFGQTWQYTNVSFIIPGSLSMYRSSVLRKLQIDAPGLIIEDFNMTFEVHKKHLGKIGYRPSIVGIHQDPYNFHDYVRQVQRWNIGFFQTVKRHGYWPSMFWYATTFYYLELYTYAIFIALSPFFILWFLLTDFTPIVVPYVYTNLTVTDILIGIFLMDYVTTVIAAYLEKKPFLLLYGLFFFILRYIDALIYLGSPIIAFTTNYSGKWKSPKRL